MTEDEIMALVGYPWEMSERKEFVAFARAIEAAEREACAKLCEGVRAVEDEGRVWVNVTKKACAAAIRARGNHD